MVSHGRSPGAASDRAAQRQRFAIAMPPPARLLRLLVGCTLAGLALGGCTTIGLVAGAAGVATDTSVTWDIVKFVHGKITEDSSPACISLNSLQRALSPGCEYTPGSIAAADLAKSGLQQCPLLAATRDPRLWRALPELLEKGATTERCNGSPLATLAAEQPCPDFAAAAPAELKSLAFLAESDPRAIRHDVFRMFSCPNARRAGLDRVLTTWLDRGELEPGKLSFSPLGAADPDLLVTRFGHELEVAGHTPEAALGSYEGVLTSGFEEALRTSHWQALEWWLYRLPQLANKVPPSRGGQLAWVPLQRVLLGGFLQAPANQRETIVFLMAHGADPRQKLPFDAGKTVVVYAAQMKSPMLALLDPPTAPATTGTAVASAEAAGSIKAVRDAPGAAPGRRTGRGSGESTELVDPAPR
jgi:hypothetical protein